MTLHTTDEEQDACSDDWTQTGIRDRSPLLARTIEGEIVPRLMMTFSVLPSPLAPPEERTPSGLFESGEDRVGELIQLLLNHDAHVSVEYLQALRSQGATLRDMYLSLLAPAARELGTMWESDSVNFAEVTIGVSRLHQILLQFSPLFCAHAAETNTQGHTAAIFALPGEMHTFGIFMVVEFFRRAGWTVYSGTLGQDADVSELLRTHDVDVLGISVSAERHLDELTDRIRALRKASRNPEIKVVVGGQVFAHNPHLVKKVGGDGFAEDGQAAVDLAQSLVGAS